MVHIPCLGYFKEDQTDDNVTSAWTPAGNSQQTRFFMPDSVTELQVRFWDTVQQFNNKAEADWTCCDFYQAGCFIWTGSDQLILIMLHSFWEINYSSLEKQQYYLTKVKFYNYSRQDKEGYILNILSQEKK